jgi:hypothetical protein
VVRLWPDPGERILAALVGVTDSDTLELSILGALTPETIARLDLLAGEIIDFGTRDELASAIAAALIKRAQ